MARKIWQGDFAQFWFGPRMTARLRPKAPRPKPKAEAKKTPGRALGIVEAHRKALREKRVLKPQH